MPHKRSATPGSFVCYHLATDNPGAASFYLRLFGWTRREIRAADSLGETTFRSGDVDVATAGASSGTGPLWLPCLAVADLGAAAAAAVRLGGAVERAPDDCASGLTVIVDPAGARLGVTGNQQGWGPAPEGAATGRICWAELVTGDPVGSAAFYEALAGWTTVERHGGQEGPYWVFWHGGREVAGMMQPREAPGASRWVPYVQVDSAEDTATLAEELGGRIVTPPGDVPGRDATRCCATRAAHWWGSSRSRMPHEARSSGPRVRSPVGTRHVIGLISDTHGLVRPDVFLAFEGVDAIYHAGDVGGRDVLHVLSKIAPTQAVYGNTDLSGDPSLAGQFAETVGGVTIHVSHGHELGSPTPARLLQRYDAQVIVYGHTHRQLVLEAGGRLVVNPGAAGPRRFHLMPSVARLTIRDGKATVEIVDLPA